MLVLNLSCRQDHHFEGWFGSAADFEAQQGRGLVSCPICGASEVQRLPSAPRLNVSHLRGPAPAQAAAPQAGGEPRLQQLRQAALQAVQQLLDKTEDVGERFAEEARRIHYGESEERGIRGQASADEARELAEEGIAVLPLPVLPKEPLH